MKRSALIFWTLLLLGAVGAVLGWRWKENQIEKPPAFPTAEVERRNLTVTVEVTGQIEPVRVVEVKSRASGEVLRVAAETGDLVPAGAVLAEIDPRDVQNALDQAEADLASAEVRARIAQAQAERLRNLFAQGVVAQQDVDAAEEAAASAEAAVLRARTNLELARERRRDVIIRAPTTGTVLSRRVEPGQIIVSATGNVSGGTTLFLMADLATMRVRANVAETDVGRIRPGMPARLTVEAHPGRSFLGTVEKVEPQAVVEQNVTLFPVLIEIDNTSRLLLPGMTAEVALEVARRPEVLAIPNGAVVGSRDLAAAATAVGVELETARQALRGPETQSPASPPRSPAPSPSDSQVACRDLFLKMRDQGGPAALSPTERETLRRCREEFRAQRGGRREGNRGEEAPETGGERRPGIVFTLKEGKVEPRRVLFGLSDWEYTEVQEGLEIGERVVLVTVAQIQRQQQQAEQRFRQRAGSFSGSPTAGSSAPRGR